MPYIITITPVNGEAATFLAGGRIGNPLGEKITRRAVATLDEAQDEADLTVRRVLDECESGYWNLAEAQAWLTAAQEMPESGGTVGPLPDGTVIEVERATRQDLLNAIGVKHAITSEGSTSVLDAYNAAQEA